MMRRGSSCNGNHKHRQNIATVSSLELLFSFQDSKETWCFAMRRAASRITAAPTTPPATATSTVPIMFACGGGAAMQMGRAASVPADARKKFENSVGNFFNDASTAGFLRIDLISCPRIANDFGAFG